MKQTHRQRVDAAMPLFFNLVSIDGIEVAEMAKNSVRGSSISAKTTQRMVISFICDKMGDSIYSVLDGGRVGLEEVLKEAQFLLVPTVSTRTMRRWIRHFLLFGETPEDTHQWYKSREVYGMKAIIRNGRVMKQLFFKK